MTSFVGRIPRVILPGARVILHVANPEVRRVSRELYTATRITLFNPILPFPQRVSTFSVEMIRTAVKNHKALLDFCPDHLRSRTVYTINALNLLRLLRENVRDERLIVMCDELASATKVAKDQGHLPLIIAEITNTGCLAIKMLVSCLQVERIRRLFWKTPEEEAFRAADAAYREDLQEIISVHHIGEFSAIPKWMKGRSPFTEHICPITREPIRFPLVAGLSSVYYEKKAVEQCLQDGQIPPDWPNGVPVNIEHLAPALELQEKINKQLSRSTEGYKERHREKIKPPSDLWLQIVDESSQYTKNYREQNRDKVDSADDLWLQMVDASSRYIEDCGKGNV